MKAKSGFCHEDGTRALDHLLGSNGCNLARVTRPSRSTAARQRSVCVSDCRLGITYMWLGNFYSNKEEAGTLVDVDERNTVATHDVRHELARPPHGTCRRMNSRFLNMLIFMRFHFFVAPEVRAARTRQECGRFSVHELVRCFGSIEARSLLRQAFLPSLISRLPRIVAA